MSKSASSSPRAALSETEVFDLHDDPEELVNLAARERDPVRCEALRERMIGALIDYSDTARPGVLPS
jgi:hypothetical protein